MKETEKQIDQKVREVFYTFPVSNVVISDGGISFETLIINSSLIAEMAKIGYEFNSAEGYNTTSATRIHVSFYKRR